MYFNFFGGSALLHLLAGHPKVVATLGIATTIGLLATGVGPRNVMGAGQQLRTLERSIAQSLGAEDITQAKIAASLSAIPRHAVERDVRHALTQCGTGCSDLTLAIVMRDETLLKDALFVAALDRAANERSAA